MCFHDDHTPHAVVVLMFQNIFTYGSIFKSLESKRKSNGRFFDASVLRRIQKKNFLSKGETARFVAELCKLRNTRRLDFGKTRLLGVEARD